MNRKIRIGIDLDNTILRYDELIFELSRAKGFIGEIAGKNKKHIRDVLRSLPSGESKWQKIQSEAYGSKITGAKLMKNVDLFFRYCKNANLRTYVISHKTKYAAADPHGVNLRTSAMGWMENNKFFSPGGLGLKKENVYFESTAKDKIAQIDRLNLTHFIDDLEEIFLEKSFPENVKKLLFAPDTPSSVPKNVTPFRSWDEIIFYFKQIVC